MSIFTVQALANVHEHLREGGVVGPLLQNVILGGADVVLPMPNTTAGLRTREQVREYIQQAEAHLLPGQRMTFIPAMMLNEKTPPDYISRAFSNGIKSFKIYPLDRTTKSQNGVRHYGRLIANVKHCGKVGAKVHLHPEHPWMTFINRDAEYMFLPIADMLLNETDATIIWEHGTDARCIPFWKEMAKSGRFFVTLTAHHLATNEDDTFGDVRATCKPPIKLESDRLGLVELVEEDHPWVMAGPDGAPHPDSTKHPAEGRASCGAYTAPFVVQLYAHALSRFFNSIMGLTTFDNFISRNARKLHGLPPPSRLLELEQKPFKIPPFYQIGPWKVESFWAGRELMFSLKR